MSRFVNVPNGNYYIKVTNGGQIELNTGVGNGKVVVTGDLEVRGTQTIIESTNTSINDNIIILNDGESGSGISFDESGLEIDRGALVNQRFVFDEDVAWLDPNTETSKFGGWHFKDLSGDLVGIRTSSITTAGGDLYLINSGTGVISVTGTNNYEDNVSDDDHIPNKKYVDDYVTLVLATTFQDTISEGSASPTYVEAKDFEVTGSNSVVEIGIDNVVRVSVKSDTIELGSLQFDGTTIRPTDSSNNLFLEGTGAGEVVARDLFSIENTIGTPASDPNRLKLYVNTENTGNTGLYFVNSSNTRDEIISNNRSLVYSMLF